MDQVKFFIITSLCCCIGIIIGIILIIFYKLIFEGTMTICFSLYIQLMAYMLLKWWWGDGF